MSVNGNFDGIRLADLYAVGERHRVPGYRSIVRDVAGAVGSWEQFADASEVGTDAAKSIAADMERFRPT